MKIYDKESYDIEETLNLMKHEDLVNRLIDACSLLLRVKEQTIVNNCPGVARYFIDINEFLLDISSVKRT